MYKYMLELQKCIYIDVYTYARLFSHHTHCNKNRGKQENSPQTQNSKKQTDRRADRVAIKVNATKKLKLDVAI